MVNLLQSPNTVGLEATMTRRLGERFGQITVFVLTLQKKVSVFEIEERDVAQSFWKNLDQLDRESEFQTTRSIMQLLVDRFRN